MMPRRLRSGLPSMSNIGKRLDSLEKKSSGGLLVLFVTDDETEEQAIARDYPDGPPPHERRVVFRTIYEAGPEEGSAAYGKRL